MMLAVTVKVTEVAVKWYEMVGFWIQFKGEAMETTLSWRAHNCLKWAATN